jgi:hypothetical protein
MTTPDSGAQGNSPEQGPAQAPPAGGSPQDPPRPGQPPQDHPRPGYGQPGPPSPGLGQPGYPQQGFQQPFAPPPYGPTGGATPGRSRTALLVGIVIGLLVGAGGLGLAWALSPGDSGGEDVEAVCGLVARTEPLSKDFAVGDMRRLAGVSELAAALAEADQAHQPLAGALEDSVRAAQMFDLPKSGSSLREAQEICDT